MSSMDDGAEYRDLPWGADPRAHWTPEQHQDWADAEQELIDQGYRPAQPVCELIATVPMPGIDRWNWICTESNFELADCTTIERELLGAEMRLVAREANGLDDDEDRAHVYELRRARGRLN
ncbi:hypothetical protein [Nocardia alba]|uniref:Uncharacterized protein n=3 Tax=Nocardia alba TaxID=225051 RepID=A0A4R1F6M8_9NOCA|nr:hypothetical protein [Nocardia alba]TCJ89957.1 hypothetical protein DFR71_6247 [Nocardia alba]